MGKPRLLLVGVDQCSWQQWKMADLAAVYDPYGYDTSALPVEVLKTPDFDRGCFDGVVFAIPNYKKVVTPLVCQALEAGLPALIYKLRVDSAADMAAVRRLPQPLRDRLWVGEHYRYLPGALALRRAVLQGQCGPVEAVRHTCALAMPDFPAWMDTYRHLILEDLAYHHMTVLYTVCGSLGGHVYAQSWSPSWTGGNRGYSACVLRSRGGWNLVYDVRWGMAGGGGTFFGELIVEGPLGAAWTDGSRAVFTARDGSSQELMPPLCPYGDWSGIVDHFGDVLAGSVPRDVPELLPFDRFDDVLRMLYAAVESAEQGREVQF